MKLILLALVLSPGVNLIGLGSVGKPRRAPVHLAAGRAPKPQTVTLAWNESPDPLVVGYNLYWGPAAHFYTNFLICGNVTNVTLTNLGAAVFHFAATAVSSIGFESDYSNEAVWTNLPPPPVTNFLLSVTVQQSGDFTNWTTFTNLGQFQATNSGVPIYWRALMNIQPQ